MSWPFSKDFRQQKSRRNNMSTHRKVEEKMGRQSDYGRRQIAQYEKLKRGGQAWK
jgi:hypothetical protein